MTVWNKIERIGYLRAARAMRLQGYPDIAKNLKKQAQDLE